MPVRTNDGIFLDASLDGAAVGRTVESKDSRVSAGFGVRVVIPRMGPLPTAPDIAFPPVKGV